MTNIYFCESFRSIIVKTNVRARKFFGNQSEIESAIKDAVNASAVQVDGKTFSKL